MTDIIPLTWRARYSVTRMIMTASGMVATYVAGEVIIQTGGLTGYEIVLIAAGVLGVGSTLSYAHIDHPTPQRKTDSDLWNAWRRFLKEVQVPQLPASCGASALLRFSLNVAAPFFSIYLVENLGAAADIVGVLIIISSLCTLPEQCLIACSSIARSDAGSSS